MVSMATRDEAPAVLTGRYEGAKRKDRGRILNESVGAARPRGAVRRRGRGSPRRPWPISLPGARVGTNRDVGAMTVGVPTLLFMRPSSG